MTTKIEHSSRQLAEAANIKKIWGGLIYNVKAKGALGDNSTDDTVAIVSTINEAKLAGGGTVFFPYMSTNYMHSGFSVPANVRLLGFGSKLKLIDNSNADMIRIMGDNVVIDGLELDGNKANQTASTILGIVGNSGSDHVTIRNNIVRNTKYDGILVGSCSNWDILNNQCYSNGRFGIGIGVSTSYILVHGNYAESSNDSGICLVGNGDNVIISNNKTKDTGGDGFAGYNQDNTNLLVTGNTFVTPLNNGTHVGGTRGITVSNNIIVRPAQYGIIMHNTNDESQILDIACHGNIVEDVQLIHSIILVNGNGGVICNNIASGALVGQGVALNSCQNVAVSGNAIRSCKGTGIRLINSFENTVVGNNIDSCGEGIRLNDSGTPCINNVISSNKVMNGTGGGIVTQNGADYNIVTDNIVLSNLFSINLAGSNNIMNNNIVPAGDYNGTATLDPISLADGEGTTLTITPIVAGFGDYVQISAPYSLQGLTVTSYVSAANTVSIRIQNETGGTIDLASGVWRAKISKG